MERYGLVVPERKDRWPNFGVLALVVAAGGLFTGVFLALNYAPTLRDAWESVRYIETQVTMGAFLRGLHHWAGNFAIVLAAIHGARLFWHGAYKAPRRMVWVLGCAIFLVMVGFAYTGYLLPGDERAYTGMHVMEGIAGSTPVAGEAVSTVLKGGTVVSSATLTRIYAVHTMVLPGVLLVLVLAFVAAWRKAGPARRHDDGSDAVRPAWPEALRRDALAAVAVLLLLGLFAYALPPALGEKLDPAGEGSPDAKPEWFLLWVNELLQVKLLQKLPMHTFVVGGLLPGLFVLLALGLPWIARKDERAPARRKPELATAAVILGVIGIATAASLASTPAKEEEPNAEVPEGGTLDEQVKPVLEKFECAKCHVIDGNESSEDSGPPLYRDGTDYKPPFPELYSRVFFRLKVADPKKFWDFTGMHYRNKRLKPSPEELDLLERWFYGDG